MDELYGAEMLAVDKETGEMYAVVGGAVNKIELQIYMDEETKDSPGFDWFAPVDTSTPKDVGIPSKPWSQSGRPSELSVIEEQPESASILTRRNFRKNRRKFKETPSISSAGDVSQEITRDEVDREYKTKNACSQRLTMIYKNRDIEKEMVHTDLEREVIEDFYDKYHLKYVKKLDGWLEVIDMYAEQELQKIEEEKQYKEQRYKPQKEREKQAMLRAAAGQKELCLDSAETEIEGLDTVTLTYMPSSVPSTRVTIVSSITGASTQLVLSTHVVSTTSIVESRLTTESIGVSSQRELGRMDALRAAASLRGTTRPMRPSQVTVTTASAVVSGLTLEETEDPFPSTQVPIGSIAPSAEGYICPGHPDAQYADVFTLEMSLSQQNTDYRLDHEEGWKLLYHFMEPAVGWLRINTPVNLACMAKNDSIVEIIQIHAYLEDVLDVWRRDFRRYPPQYGDPNYIYRPRTGGEVRDRECMKRIREWPNTTERDREDCAVQGNRVFDSFEQFAWRYTWTRYIQISS